jgi:hypothetical protein
MGWYGTEAAVVIVLTRDTWNDVKRRYPRFEALVTVVDPDGKVIATPGRAPSTPTAAMETRQ